MHIDLCEKHEKIQLLPSGFGFSLVFSLSLVRIHNAKWNCLINHALSADADLAVGICHISARRWQREKHCAFLVLSTRQSPKAETDSPALLLVYNEIFTLHCFRLHQLRRGGRFRWHSSPGAIWTIFWNFRLKKCHSPCRKDGLSQLQGASLGQQDGKWIKNLHHPSPSPFFICYRARRDHFNITRPAHQRCASGSFTARNSWRERKGPALHPLSVETQKSGLLFFVWFFITFLFTLIILKSITSFGAETLPW